MEYIKLLLSGNLIFIFVTAVSLDENSNSDFRNLRDVRTISSRLSDHVVPKMYNIQLTLDIERDIFNGEANVDIIIYKETQAISLHSANLSYGLIPILTSKSKYRPQRFMVQNISYVQELQIVSFHFDVMITPGNYSLYMIFMGNNVDSFSTASHINKKGNRNWIAKYYSAIGMRHLFPCWDQPGFKANFSITIKHHKQYVALSNGPVLWAVDQLRSKEKITMTRFETTSTISTCHIAIILFQLSSSFLLDRTLWCREQSREHLRYASSVIKNIKRHFENKIPRQLNKSVLMGHFTMPGLLNDGTNKWKIAIYREEDIIYNEEIDSIARKIEVSRLIGRKVIGQWFGAMVSPTWWSYMWLNEGIATLFTIDFINKTIPESRMLDLFVVQTQQESLYLDDKEIMNPLTTDLNSTSEINSLFSFTYYLKAPVILRMLQLSLGNEVFQKGIDIYLKRQSGTPDDFWAAIQSVYHEGQALRPEKFNVTKIMDPWTKQKHYPVINVTSEPVINVSRNQELIVISRNDTESETRSTPLTFTRQTYFDFNDTSSKMWLRPSDWTADLGFIDKWVIMNLQQSGYYRVTYDTNNWRKIVQYLDSENYTKIHVLNRAQIIDDAFHFMMSGKLSCPIFWEVTSYLSRETDYIAWYPMIKAIERISHILPFPQSKQLKIKILSRLNPLLQKIGYDDDPNNNHLTKCLRQEAVKWACVLDDPHCIIVANNKLHTYLANPTLNKVLPWKEWTFCNGLKKWFEGPLVQIFTRGFELYLEKHLKAINLEFLACSVYFNIEPMYIEGIKAKCYSGDSIDKNKTCIKSYNRFFHRFIARHAKNDSVLDYILDNLKKIKPEEISTPVALTDIINHVYSWKQLEKIREYVKNMEKLSSVKIIINHEYDISLSFTTKEQMEKLIQNNLKLLVSAIQNKISIRLSEIERHLSYIPMCA